MEEARRESEDQVQQRAASFKSAMMKKSTKSGLNLYDHLTRLLMKVMDEETQDAVDVIEEMSHGLKQRSSEDMQSDRGDAPETTAAEALADEQRSLFSRPEDAPQEEELQGESPLPNVSEIAFYLEQAGVGLGREEMHRVFLALKQLVESQAIVRCRLWGKILGTENSYLVAEAECREGGEEEEEEEEREVRITTRTTEEERAAESQDDDENERDAPPELTFKPPPVVPKEEMGTGANKYVYYVCKEPGLPWTRLPSVTPAQITIARQIRKFFTGNLDAPVNSYPPFPGNEANYLRAQIARISAGTHVSPQGYYHTGGEEGDEEEEAPRDTYDVNPDFEGLAVAEMAESLTTWVHHVQHILKQGRCTWVNLAVTLDDSNEDEEADEEKEEEPDEVVPEVGPRLLTPLSQDEKMFHTPPWSSRISSTLTPQHAVAVLRSNLWPGAYAYARGKKFENIYIGWGLKYAGEWYSPPVPPPPQTEYPSEPEITEALDPTLEEEQDLMEALEEQEDAQEQLEESDGDDDDDDDQDDD